MAKPIRTEATPPHTNNNEFALSTNAAEDYAENMFTDGKNRLKRTKTAENAKGYDEAAHLDDAETGEA